MARTTKPKAEQAYQTVSRLTIDHDGRDLPRGVCVVIRSPSGLLLKHVSDTTHGMKESFLEGVVEL